MEEERVLGEKALEGAIQRLKNRPEDSYEEVESSDFSDGERSWGDWSNSSANSKN